MFFFKTIFGALFVFFSIIGILSLITFSPEDLGFGNYRSGNEASYEINNIFGSICFNLSITAWGPKSAEHEDQIAPILAAPKNEITDSAVRRVMVAAGDDLDDLLTLCRADITTKNPQRIKKYMGNFERVEVKIQDVTERDSLQAFQSPVRGDEILRVCGISEGRVVGQIKNAIEEAILDEKIDNNYEAALSYFMEIKDGVMAESKRG